MADETDVSNALVALVAQTVYPNGTQQPSITGFDIRVFAGWPISQNLDADLKAGKTNVSVYPRQEERNTTRYPQDWQQLSVNTPTLGLTINGQQVTVGGSVPPANNPTNVVVVANKKPYVYAVQTSDTLTSIATALAALIAADIAGTTSAGPVITLPNSARINAARVGITGTSIRELRRQERVFQVSVWSDIPANREAVAKPVDVALAATTFLTLTDGTRARLIYKGSPVSDSLQKDKLYRRDLFYTVEYATTQVETETQITETQLNQSGSLDGVNSLTPVTTTYQ
jgi:hypothetical protein